MDTQFPNAVDGSASEATVEMRRKTLKERLRRPLMIAFPILLAAVGAAGYVVEKPYVSTDDAFIREAKVSINSRVSGQVVELAVRDNQHVRKGALLFRIDPKPYRIAVDQAKAKLVGVRLQIETLKTKYREQLAELRSAKATATFDEDELKRERPLLASDFTTKSAFERAETRLEVARQNVASIEQQLASTVVSLNGDPDLDVGRHPAVREAAALLARARLDLSYTRVLAPEDGVVTKVDDLQVGDFVTPGATVFSLMSSRDMWIEANFRETDLDRMRPGEPAAVSVDAYPGHIFKAHIVSMSPGTGSELALLPPENATGNWVKVVQRLPVRLEIDGFDERRPLYSGVSVTVRVNTGQPPVSAPADTAATAEADR